MIVDILEGHGVNDLGLPVRLRDIHTHQYHPVQILDHILFEYIEACEAIG